MKPTLNDMATILNLSKSTVSRALSGDPRIAEGTRARVTSLATQIGYRPNPMAQALATRRTNTIGLAVPHAPRSFSDPFYLEFLGAVGDAAMRSGYSLFLSAASADGASGYRSHVEMADATRVDGMILTEPAVDDERAESLRRAGVPFVFLGMSSDPEVSWVSGDNVDGATQAVSHLVQLGHRRIACITGPDGQTATRARFAGYRAALTAAGIALDRNLIAEGSFTQAGGYAAMKSILAVLTAVSDGAATTAAEPDPPTAVFACNDVMALGAMRALREAGLAIPSDVSVVGFDGIALGEYVDPPLATVRQPIAELGQAAVRILIDAMGAPAAAAAEPVHQLLPVEFRPAASIAAVR